MDAISVEERIKVLLRHGEQADARALLVDEYGARVLTLCRGMVRDPAAAEDLKQDTFERAFASMDEYRGEATMVAWLLRIARNRCVDHLRRDRHAPVTAFDPDDPPALDARDAAEVIAGLQRAEFALAVLDPDDRALVLLHHVHGVDYADLAASFGSTDGALRMRMSRALGAMRAELEAIERGSRKKRRSWIGRDAIWAAIVMTVLCVGSFGVYHGVVLPQREAQAALQRQLTELQEESAYAQAALEEAQRSGASDVELQRLRDELALAQANAQAAVSGDTASIMRSASRRAPSASGSRSTSTSTGGCMGPLCALMR